jgi:hypothetical protein
MNEKSENMRIEKKKNFYVHIERKNEKKRRRKKEKKSDVQHYAIIVLEGN